MEDQTLEDFKFWNLPPPDFAVSLAFLGDCDGPGDALLAGIRRTRRGRGRAAQDIRALRRLRKRHRPARMDAPAFGASVGELRQLDRPHRAAGPQGSRAARQVAARACDTMCRRIRTRATTCGIVRDHLRRFAQQHPDLIPAKTRTPVGWWIGNALHWATLPLLLILSWAVRDPDDRLLSGFSRSGSRRRSRFSPLLAFLYLIWVAPFTFALLVALGTDVRAGGLPCARRLLLLVVIFVIVLRRYEKGEPNDHSRADHRARPRSRQARGSRHHQSVFGRRHASSRARSAA